LMADVILNPVFPEMELERQRKQRLDHILQERNSPPTIARKVFRAALFGDQHPFGKDSAGSESSVKAMSRDDCRQFYEAFWKPNHSALVFAGAINLDESLELSEATLAQWPPAKINSKEMALVTPPADLKIYLVDRQDAPQSQVRLGSIGPRRTTADHHAIELMNLILGGSFSSRLNLNLREDKGYTYGASSAFAFGRRLGFWSAGAGVQTQFTCETLLELLKEVSQIRGERPITPGELAMAQENLVRGFAQRFETLVRLVDQVVDIVSFELPLQDLRDYPKAVEGVMLEEVQAAAKTYLNPQQAVAVIVGDLRQIETPLRALNLGEVFVVDAWGRKVR